MNKENMIEQKSIKSFILYFIFLLTSILIFLILHFNSNIQLSPMMLLLISLYSSWIVIKNNEPTPYQHLNLEKWFCLYTGIIIIFISIIFNLHNSWFIPISLFFLMLSITAYFGGRKIVYKTILPLFVLIIILPFYEEIYYWLSFPVRLICTNLTVFTLSIFGVNISSEATIITVGNKRVAITAACSGLVLMETLTWIGWLIVMFTHNSCLNKVFHFIMIVPLVFLANTLRLAVLVILFSHYGEIIIVSPIHIWMGYIMIVFASILFYLCKFLFDEKGITK